MEMLIERFITAKLSEGKQPKTCHDYAYCLHEYVKYLHSNNIAHPDKESIQKFLLYKAPTVSKFRLRNYWVSLKSFYTWADDENLIDINPTLKVRPPKTPKRAIRIYTKHEIILMLSACKSDRDRFIITVYLKTGMRASELLSLHRDDFDMETGTLIVHGKGDKYRPVPFGGEVSQSLELLADDVRNLSYSGMRDMVKRTCKQAGVKYRSPHTLRHTFACDYLLAGGSPLALKKILGHTTMTMVNYYTEWVADIVAAQDYHKLFGLPGEKRLDLSD